MNIDSDTIIINQCDKFDYQEFSRKGNMIKFLSFKERGIGLSRNTAFMRSDADICLFSDDDVEYIDGYEKIIIDEFNSNPNADIIFFNLPSKNPNRPEYLAKKFSRVRFYNSLRYGAFRIAIRRDKLIKSNISFSLLFGGGAKYSSGEDSLFVHQCIKAGLRAYSSPRVIGSVKQEESTWFNGYNEKFFYDKGALFKYLSPNMYYLLIIQFILRKYQSFKNNKSRLELIKITFNGTKD